MYIFNNVRKESFPWLISFFFFLSFLPPVTTCSGDQFRCLDGTCISIDKRCNQNIDCRNGEDEKQCGESARSCLLMNRRNCFNHSQVTIGILKRRWIPMIWWNLTIDNLVIVTCLFVVSKVGRYLRITRVWAHFLKATSRSWTVIVTTC